MLRREDGRRSYRDGRRRLFGVVGLALVVTGCTSVGSTAVPDAGQRVVPSAAATPTPTPMAEPSVAAIPSLLDVTDRPLPIEAYVLDQDEVRRVDMARVKLLNHCLARSGIDATLPGPAGTYGPVSMTERRYGVVDAALAAAHGYGLGPRGEPPVVQRPDLGPEGEVVLFGPDRADSEGPRPPGGCLGEVDRLLRGAVPAGAEPQLPDEIAAESYYRSERDSRVRAAVTDWSRCMAERGYDYADPLAPFDDPALGDGDTPAARTTALDDIACKDSTNLIGVWYTVEAAYQEVLIERSADELDLVRDALAAQLRLADGYLDD